MPDSIRIKEIHAALGASQYASDLNGDDRYMNIARNIEFIMNALGLYYNPDGTLRDVVYTRDPVDVDD